MFLNKTTDESNLDMSNGRNLEYYLDMTKDYKHDFTFKVKQYDGFNVVDDGEFQFGTKAKMGDFFISQVKEDAMVYVAPRTGYAPYSLCHLAKKYNKKLYLVMPASKEASDHQLTAIENGGIPLFVKIPAMPTANIWAKQFAERIGAKYLPFGLKHESVVAGGVRIFYDNFKDTDIETMWSVFSTGVLSRTLQIALPKTKFNAVAVARNVQDGELGRAKFYTHDRPFLKASRIETPFDSIQTYDAKGWELLKTHGQQGDWFWNVAGNMPKAALKASDIDSSREWGDFKDFKNYYKD
jgi:hypothetical protein